MENIKEYLMLLPMALISLTVHECAHGYVAYKLGDPTAKQEGRLTLNPIKHIDPVGLLMMLFLRVGYAKPVPVNPLYFKNSKKGMMLTALAGPASNIILAIISVILAEFFAFTANKITVNFIEIFFYMAILNFGYAVFNLIPVYPLDGSRILGYFMPQSFNDFFIRYGSYIQIAFFVLLILTDVVSNAVWSVQSFLYQITATAVYYPMKFLIGLF